MWDARRATRTPTPKPNRATRTPTPTPNKPPPSTFYIWMVVCFASVWGCGPRAARPTQHQQPQQHRQPQQQPQQHIHIKFKLSLPFLPFMLFMLFMAFAAFMAFMAFIAGARTAFLIFFIAHMPCKTAGKVKEMSCCNRTLISHARDIKQEYRQTIKQTDTDTHTHPSTHILR